MYLSGLRRVELRAAWVSRRAAGGLGAAVDPWWTSPRGELVLHRFQEARRAVADRGVALASALWRAGGCPGTAAGVPFFSPPLSASRLLVLQRIAIDSTSVLPNGSPHWERRFIFPWISLILYKYSTPWISPLKQESNHKLQLLGRCKIRSHRTDMLLAFRFQP